MKKFFALMLAMAMALSLIGCGTNTTPTTEAPTQAAATEAAEPVELIVFAAASMTETLTELGQQYMAEHQNVNIIFNFDSSGTLKTQIQEGAHCDIFISAGQTQMDALDCVLKGTRFDMLENKVVLAVPDGNPAGINAYEDLKGGNMMLAICNSDVPVGQYTRMILDYLQLEEEELVASGAITYGSNVKELCTQISESAVDCGIIYETDAFSAGLTVVDTATVQMCGQVIYPAAVMNTTGNEEAAVSFLAFLTSDAADAVFESVGFTPVA